MDKPWLVQKSGRIQEEPAGKTRENEHGSGHHGLTVVMLAVVGGPTDIGCGEICSLKAIGFLYNFSCFKCLDGFAD